MDEPDQAPVREPSPEVRRYRTTRLEAFSDGVFAIAITLLVLEIAIPAGSEEDLAGALLAQWPSYLAYLVSFSTVGAIWLAHSSITEHLGSVDAVFLRLNLLLLLVVSFLPFPTRLLGEHLRVESAERVAVTVYGLTLFAASVVMDVLWRWARRAHLLRETVTDEDVEFLNRRLTPGVAGYLPIIVVGLFAPFVAVFGYLAVAVFFLVPVGSLRAARRAVARQG